MHDVEGVEEESEVEEEDEDEEESEEEAEEEEKIKPSNRDSIRKLLEPFGKDQLIELLKEAALKDSSLAAQIAAAAESGPVHRKIRSRPRLGRAAARRDHQKHIGRRVAHCQLASFGVPAGPTPEPTGRKIFVTNVPENVNRERLLTFFANFGEIEEGALGHDRATGKPRSFAIFTYKTVEGCKKALEELKKFFEGCELTCQRALEGLKPKTPVTPATMKLGTGAAGVLQPNDLALTCGLGTMLGLVGGLLRPSLDPLGGPVGQNVGVGGIGLLNPAAAEVAGMSPSVVGSGGTPQPQFGVGLGGLGGGGVSGISSVTSGVIGSYGSQAALQGLGAYQGAQISLSVGMRSPSGIGSLGTGWPSYLGH